jgi:tetratricopeptide (TPR) repeat protein
MFYSVPGFLSSVTSGTIARFEWIRQFGAETGHTGGLNGGRTDIFGLDGSSGTGEINLAHSLPSRTTCVEEATTLPRLNRHKNRIAMPYLVSSDRAYLSTYRLPRPSFSYVRFRNGSLSATWDALRDDEALEAAITARRALDSNPPSRAVLRAALMSALAVAHLMLGATEQARRAALKSIELLPSQWLSNRVLLELECAEQCYEAAYDRLHRLDPGPVSIWDEPLTQRDKHVALASLAWNLKKGKAVASHLKVAYPDGVSSMPVQLQEDWFRLALYRDRPRDAVAVARILIEECTIDLCDELLQTFVQNGWTRHALPLYRIAYSNSPDSELLRRRLVALCIREGKIEEARILTRPGALGLAA